MKIPTDGIIASWAWDMDDYEPYEAAEYFYKKWSSCVSYKDVTFTDQYDITYALAMQVDGILPSPAQKALALRTLDAIWECRSKSLKVNNFFIEKPKPGRKKLDPKFKGEILFNVQKRIKQGMKKADAYLEVANILNKSPDTIRRMYERSSYNKTTK